MDKRSKKQTTLINSKYLNNRFTKELKDIIVDEVNLFSAKHKKFEELEVEDILQALDSLD